MNKIKILKQIKTRILKPFIQCGIIEEDLFREVNCCEFNQKLIPEITPVSTILYYKCAICGKSSC